MGLTRRRPNKSCSLPCAILFDTRKTLHRKKCSDEETADPKYTFLAAAFNLCLRYHKVTQYWKTSKTILIFNKGDPDDPLNWRPITLMCTINKLHTGCLASSLQSWIIDNHILSHCQEGFIPFHGVFEHNFVLQTLINKARTKASDLCTALLDFSNAFGSVPHNAIVQKSSKTSTTATTQRPSPDEVKQTLAR
ncbi:uncharacterized protein LOC135374509 [Ornithodoros turicata]|uniref:uncharacterized protein LOC135374509 n=1 Tax=Ornithodoros turicata TaxID=34597 RepID=UPI00313A2A31